MAKDTITRAPIWQQEKRPDYLNTKDKSKQPRVSRGWLKNDGSKDKDEERKE
jgi:spore germination protein KA